jgi:hypothetical protein
VPALAVGAFGVSFGVVSYNVIQVSFRQRPQAAAGPDERLDPVRGVGDHADGALPGRPRAGAGRRATLWITVGGLLLAGLTVLFSPLRRMGDLPQALLRTRTGLFCEIVVVA